ANVGWHKNDGDVPVASWDLYFDKTERWYYESPREHWADFAAKARNGDETPFDEYPALLTEDFSLVSEELDVDEMLYRARPGFDGTLDDPLPYSGGAIGAKAAEEFQAARANRDGQRVLYCAALEHTALCEVRPSIGEWVSVCSVTPRR